MTATALPGSVRPAIRRKNFKKRLKKISACDIIDNEKICTLFSLQRSEAAMGKYFGDYIKAMLAALENEESDFLELKKEILVKIQFMQHERLIHFLVTMMFAILLIMCFAAFLLSENMGMLAAAGLMLVLLVPYIGHYYFLENGVQKLYYIYDKICEKIK